MRETWRSDRVTRIHPELIHMSNTVQHVVLF
jgi:hypothetical protein